MPKTPVYEIRKEDSGATLEDLTPIIPDGKVARVIFFGAAVPINGIVDLYFGKDGDWQYLRSITEGTYEFTNINEDYLGDGEKRFRIVRTRTGGAGPLQIKIWFKAIEREIFG